MTARTLPAGWTQTTLGKATTVSPRDPALHSAAPFVTMSAVKQGIRHPVSYELRGTRSGIRARGNDILFARITPCLENGKVALLPSAAKPTGGSTEFIVIRPTSAVNPAFLYYWCLHPEVRNDAQHQMAGATGRMRLSASDLANFVFVVPPLPEQHRIVEALEDHLSRLDAAELILNQAKARAAALSSKAINFSRSTGTTGIATSTTGSAVPPTPADVVDGDLPRLPASWSWRRLGELAEVVGGITKDSKKQSDESYTVHPYLRVANVQAGHLNLDHITDIRATPKQVEKLTLRDGDVLLNEGGDRDKLGRGWIWENQIPNCLHQNHIFRARVDQEEIDPRLIAWHANSFGRSWFMRNGKNTRYTVEAVRNALGQVTAPSSCQPPIQTAFDAWAGYLMLDAWVAGRDRHHENWAANDRGGELRLAPSFDHGNALGFQEPESKARALAEDDEQLVRWARRGRSHHFGTKPGLVLLASTALELAGDGAREYWLGRLSDVTDVHIESVIAQIPTSYLSDPGRTFRTKLLRLNRERILHGD